MTFKTDIRNYSGLDLSKHKYFTPFVLRFLIVLNFFFSAGHYADNVLRFSRYPEPIWLHAHSVDGFWFVLVAWLILPFKKAGEVRALNNVSYSIGVFIMLSSLSALHYFYAPFAEIPLRIHFFIFLQVIGSILLLPYALQIGNRIKPSWIILTTLLFTVIPLIFMMLKSMNHDEYTVSIILLIIFVTIIRMFFKRFSFKVLTKQP